MTYDSKRVAFVDVETTGLHPEFCEIWEIAIIVDGVEHLWQNRVSPGVRIDPWVKENGRFAEVYDKFTALKWEDTVEKFVDLLKDRHIVGACPWFDSERLHRMYLKYTAFSNPEDQNHPWHYHHIDIENCALPLTYRGHLTLPWKSDALIQKLEAPIFNEEEHSAISDARWARDVFEHIFGEPESDEI